MNIKSISTLNRIDEVILKKSESEGGGLFKGLAGCSIYFSGRYFQTQKNQYHNYSVELLESIISKVDPLGLPHQANLAIPFFSPCWLIDQYTKIGVLDETEKMNMEPILNHVDLVLHKDLAVNRHDLFYGFIGAGIMLIENDAHANRSYIDKIIGALKVNAIQDNAGVYWNTPDPFYVSPTFEKTINFGIPHGSCGIILFLLKCYDIYNYEELKPLLKASIDWIIDRLEKENNRLPYSYSTKPSGTGKLGWCYGDQAIAFTLLRYSETFSCKKAWAKAYELIEQAASKTMEQTGVQYYPKYGYYDLRLCHGTSSVAYMWQKMYLITKDESIKSLADKWMNITLDNLDVFLPQLDKITGFEKGNDMIDISMGFLNGLSCVGLALISFLEPTLSSWDKLLLLDRPGRDLEPNSKLKKTNTNILQSDMAGLQQNSFMTQAEKC